MIVSNQPSQVGALEAPSAHVRFGQFGFFLIVASALALLLLPLTAMRAEAAESGARFAVATENAASTRAALQVLEGGGSAVDAAIAASAMLGVAAPSSCGLGGGGFALVYDASLAKVTILDYRETAPAVYDAKVRSGKAPGATIGTPGEPAGLVELHRRWGKRAFVEDLAPAMQAADGGFEVSPFLAKSLARHTGYFTGTPYGAVFAPGGLLATAGARVTNPALGATLRRLGTEGAKAFYQGAVAEEIVSAASAAGSPLALSDLASYRVFERTPLRSHWGTDEVVTMPEPSAGGVLLLETLALYSKDELRAMGFGSSGYTHMLAEAMRGALADRLRTIGDPAYVTDQTAELLWPLRMRARRAQIGAERTHAPPQFTFVERGTSHLVVADARGNVVSLTTTVNAPFGSGVFVPRAGFVLNNELDDFTRPEVAARFGVLPGPNAPRAGARPVSSMTPTIVFRDGAPIAALGGSGGFRIAGNVTQVLLCRLVAERSAEECVARPRFFTPLTKPSLEFGPGQLPSYDAQLDLLERGEQVQEVSTDDSAVQMVTFDRSGPVLSMQAASDPRKGGVAVVK